MVVGVCVFQLHLHGVQSLKSKRGIIKRLKAKISNKFNVSVAEVDHLDTWQRSALAVAIVSNEQKFANQVLSKIRDHIAMDGEAELIGQEMEFI